MVCNDTYTQFFKELKQYNSTNFKTLHTANLADDVDVDTKKAFSSVVTRYFIFCEKHPELSVGETNMLYYKLKIDMIARYFSNYPNSNIDELKPFQLELQNYLELRRTQAEQVEDSQVMAI